jgi:small-conductance mechanosensitive channel
LDIAQIFTVETLSLLGVVAAFYAATLFIKRRVKNRNDRFFYRFYQAVIAPVQILFLVTVVYLLSRQFDYAIEDNVWLHKAYVIAIIVAVTWLLIKLVQFASNRVLRRFDTSVKDNLQARSVHTQINVIRRLIISLIIILAIAAILMTFEQIRSLGVSLLASAGVAGIVLGLAAQKTLGNFFTGLQIAITQPIRLDDSVVVEGEWGWIEEINLTYVVVKLWDLRRLVLPIQYFVDNPFQNWTRKSAEIIGSVFLRLDYTMPIEPIREELDRILEGNDLWNGNVKVVQVTDSGQREMEVRVLVSANDAPTAWDLRCNVRERLITFIQQNYEDKLPRYRSDITLQNDTTQEGNNHDDERTAPRHA